MTRYDINLYLSMLKISLDHIKKINDKYNKNLNSFKYKYELDYHIFSFTQIVYALQERIKTDYPNSWSENSEIFEKGVNIPLTELGLVIKIANKSKHEDSLDLIQNFSGLRLFHDGSYRPTKVEKIIKSKYNLNHRDKPLINIFSNCYKQLEKLIKQLKSE